MPDFSLINQFFVSSIGLGCLFLAFWVYFTNRKSKINQLFFWLGIFLFLWIILCYLGNTANNPDTALLLGRLAYGIVALFFIPFYFFSIKFLSEEKKFPVFNIFVLVSSILLWGFSIFTELMVVRMEFTKSGAIPVLGRGKVFYFGIILILALFVVSRFLRNYLKSSAKKRLRLQYFLMGIAVWVVANLIFNVILPFWQRIPQYYYIGNYSAIFLLAFTAYAIVKRELFGIKVVLTYFLVVLIAILLALDTLVFTSQLSLQILKAAILVVFLGFGYLLIKSVLGEIKRREELEKLTSQLEAAHIKLSRAYQKLQRLDIAKSEFISIASHQLRAPLTVIKGYVSMLLEGTYGKLDERELNPLANIYKSNERLIKLVNDLLNISRIEAGRVELKLEEISIEEIIASVVQELKIEAEKKGLELRWQKHKRRLPKILVDKEKIRQAFLNVIDNAVRYTKSGYVAITANPKSEIRNYKHKEDKIVIKIKDTGEGLTEEEIAKLFESFSRGRAGAKLWTEGTGLGLYVAKKFVQMHQGRIWAESEGKGRGSTFFIELPVK